MIYFDNAASGGRKPDCVISAVQSSIRVCANPGRSGHKLSVSLASIVEDCRNALSDFFDGYGYERVIFTKNCTEALNIAILGSLKQGDHVIVSCFEHNSVLRPLEFLKQSGMITYDVCYVDTKDKLGGISPNAVQKLLKPNTKLVAITAASNVNGYLPPISEIKKILPPHVLFLCDGAQAGGHFPLSMQKIGIDFLTLAGHKGLCGIQGSGALLFSPRANPNPVLYGGTGSMSLSLDMPDFYPDALEAGTLSYPAIVSLLYGVEYLSLQLPSLQRHVFSLTQYLLSRLEPLKNFKSYSLPNPCGIVAFAHMRIQSEEIAMRLSENFDIAVRGGLHCAPLAHEGLGTQENGLVRVSFSHFNSMKEIDELLFALEKIDKEM